MRKVAELTLWHGTVVDNYNSIKSFGLQPMLGDFTKQFYDEDGIELEEILFMADKSGFQKAVNAMNTHIAAKLGKSPHDITDEEIERYGLLVKVKGEAGKAISPIEYYDPKDRDNYQNEHPHTVEPQDHYSFDSLAPTDLFIGKNLVKVLKRYGAWPAAWSNGSTQKTKDYLVELLKRYHPDKSIETIRSKVEELNDKDILKWISTYKNLLKEQKSMRKVIKSYLDKK